MELKLLLGEKVVNNYHTYIIILNQYKTSELLKVHALLSCPIFTGFNCIVNQTYCLCNSKIM